MAVFQALKQPYGIAQALNHLGNVARLQGAYGEAATRYEESLALIRQSRLKSDIAATLHNLGYAVLAQGLSRRAAALFTEGLALQDEVDNRPGIAECLTGLAGVATAEGQPDWAAQLLGVVDALREAGGWFIWPAEQMDYERHRAATQAQLDEAAFAAAWTAGQALSVEAAVAAALRRAS